ncbi:MAG: hypothetical protein FWC60_07500 [Firmicutes bacterium]|nr:hypothetical protein [Bacillota bacterium]
MAAALVANNIGVAGPVLQDGLIIRPQFTVDLATMSIYSSGADVFYQGTKVFSVNETGRQLLSLADGTLSIAEMVRELHLEENDSEAAMFFVTLGQSGFLKNRIEIEIYATKDFKEGL